MNEDLEKKEVSAASEEEQYSLNDDRRVKVLSPGAMVAKRFFRNRIAVVGLCILAFMFIFSFIDATFFALFGTSIPALSIHYLLCPLIKVAIFVGVYIIYRRLFPHAFRHMSNS